MTRARPSKTTAPPPRRLLRTVDAAHYVGLSESTLEKYRVSGGGPRFVKIGRAAVAYRLEDLDAWIDSRPRLESTSDACA